jgi:predicted amidohydrolase
MELPATFDKQHPLNIDLNLEQAGKLIDKCGKLCPDIVCLPEGFATKGIFKSYSGLSQSVPDGIIGSWVRQKALQHKTHIVAPILEKTNTGNTYITAFIFDYNGNIIGKYRKVHITDEEKGMGVRPGRLFPVFELTFGKIAILICNDLKYPEIPLIYLRKSADFIFWPTMWAYPADYVIAYMRGQAVATGKYFISANFAMPGKDRAIGHSMIISPTGDIMANTGNKGGIAHSDIELINA